MLQWIARLTTRQVFVLSAAWIIAAVLFAWLFIVAMLKRIHRTESSGFNLTSVSVEPVRAALLLFGPPLCLIALRALAR